MFKNPFSFEGRIRRTEYGISMLIYYAFYIAILFFLMGLDSNGEYNGSETGTIIGFIVLIPLLWFIIAQACKRCHDRGNSGWWQLIPFYIIGLLFLDSEHGDNRFGPNPKGIGNVDEVDEIGQHLENQNYQV